MQPLSAQLIIDLLNGPVHVNFSLSTAADASQLAALLAAALNTAEYTPAVPVGTIRQPEASEALLTVAVPDTVTRLATAAVQACSESMTAAHFPVARISEVEGKVLVMRSPHGHSMSGDRPESRLVCVAFMSVLGRNHGLCPT